MKKILALLAASAMVLSLAACNNDNDKPPEGGSDNNNDGDQSSTTTTSGEPEPAPAADPEPIDVDPVYYWGFEDAEGLTSVYRAPMASNPDLTGATYSILPGVHEIMIAEGKGVVGNALYLDGKYGVQLDDIGPVSDDTYTVSFWYSASRFGTFGPIVAIGRNIGMSDDNTVTWLNFTKTEWGANPDDNNIAPVVWSKNSAYEPSSDFWPWIGANDALHGRKEWCHVALVVSGDQVKTTNDLGVEIPARMTSQLYVDGVLKMEFTSDNTVDSWMGVAPEVFNTDDGIYGVEGYIGINYWDTIFKGYVDELYIYDEALTAGQIQTLYQLGDGSGEYEDIAYEGELDEEAVAAAPPPAPELPEVTPDASAIDTVGVITRDNGFWTDTSDGFELPDGGVLTITMNNYSDGVNVWDNPVFGYSNTAVTTDKVASADNFPGYAEYGVTRIDGINGAAWGAGTATFDKSWTDDATFMSAMMNAKVAVVFTREANVITAVVGIVGADGADLTETIVFTANDMAADAPCYVHITNERCYTEILSVD